MNIEDVKQIPIADYLHSLGYSPVKQRAELRDRTAGPDLQETNFPYGGFLPEILERCSIVCKDRIWYDKYITVQTADR